MQPVALVNGKAITLLSFQKQVRLQRLQLITQYWQYEQYAQALGADSVASQINLIQTMLQDSQVLGQDALNSLIEAELIRQEAARRNIAIAPAEIDQAIQAAFGYYPDGTPTPQPSDTPLPGTVLPTAASTQPPASTPTPYTAAAFQHNFQSLVALYTYETRMGDQDIRALFEIELYRTKLTEAWEADLQVGSVHARHILVADEATALDIIRQLQAGGDFTALAAQYSTDTTTASNAGDLGYFPRGQMVAEFDQACFTNPVGLILTPVKTTFGWHVIEILDQKPETSQQARQRAVQEWLTAQRSDAQVVTVFDIWKQNVPVEPPFDPSKSPTPFPTAAP
jgi:foldase protein PrsA